MPDEEFPPFGGPPVGFETTPVPEKKAEIPAAPAERSDQSNALLGRIRDLERRFADLQELMKFHEEESRKNINRLWTKLKEAEERVIGLSHSFAEVEQQSHLMVNELRLTAKREDYEVLKRYIEYIKPVKFVTVDQVERLVKDILEEHSSVKKTVEE